MSRVETRVCLLGSCDGKLLTRPIDKLDGRSFYDTGRDAFGIPIREAHTAMRFGLGDLLGRGCSVQAVALSRKTYPDGSDRIVRSWPDSERLVGFYALELVSWIVSVSGVVTDL